MKEDMLVVGVTAITDDIMKLELVPLNLVQIKKKPMDLTDAQTKMMNGVSLQEIAKDLKGELVDPDEEMRKYRNIIYRSRQWCSDNDIIPFRHLTLEITLGDLAKERLNKK